MAERTSSSGARIFLWGSELPFGIGATFFLELFLAIRLSLWFVARCFRDLDRQRGKKMWYVQRRQMVALEKDSEVVTGEGRENGRLLKSLLKHLNMYKTLCTSNPAGGENLFWSFPVRVEASVPWCCSSRFLRIYFVVYTKSPCFPPNWRKVLCKQQRAWTHLQN